MVNSLWPVLPRVVVVPWMKLLIAAFVGSASLIPMGQTARGEVRETNTLAADVSENELQQPRHFMPLPANPRDERAAGGRRRTKSLSQHRRGPAHFAESSEQNVSVPPQFARQVNFQTGQEPPTTMAPGDPLPSPTKRKPDPCAALVDRPFSEFQFDIAMPGGDAPENHARDCWEPINASAGPLAAARCWGATTFAWNATCLCHRPLYFEEINLERYGYGCCESLQPAASAAHFFATIPALPYCMATDCPCECNYTLGHYRPGSCPPWQCHWPRFTTRAALAEGGVWTGLVFLIP